MSDIHLKRIEYIRTMLDDQPDDPFLHFALAKELDATGNSDAALKAYEKVKELDSGYLGLYYHLAELQYRMGNPDTAVKTAEAGIQIGKTQGASKDVAELYQLLESF